jgi:hypothetical protein
MNRFQSFARPSLIIALLLALSGCGGPKNVTVNGKVTRNGQPLPCSKTGKVWVCLSEDKPVYNTYFADADAEGAFAIPNVPIGRYRVEIQHQDPTPQDDKLKGAYARNKTKIIRDVDGKNSLEIDLGKPEG